MHLWEAPPRSPAGQLTPRCRNRSPSRQPAAKTDLAPVRRFPAAPSTPPRHSGQQGFKLPPHLDAPAELPDGLSTPPPPPPPGQAGRQAPALPPHTHTPPQHHFTLSQLLGQKFAQTFRCHFFPAAGAGVSLRAYPPLPARPSRAAQTRT